MWAGLLTEAGELECKGYKRAEAIERRDQRHTYRFHFKLNEEIKASAITYAGLYTARRGGELIGMRSIVPPDGTEWYMDVNSAEQDGELRTKPPEVRAYADEFALNWYIRFNKDTGENVPEVTEVEPKVEEPSRTWMVLLLPVAFGYAVTAWWLIQWIVG